MRHIVRWMSASVPGLLLVAGMGLTACDKGSNGAAPVASATATPPPPTPTAPAAPAAASSADVAADEAINEDLRDYHRHHHHGGVTMFISMAIDTLGLDAAKKAQVEKIQTDLHAKMAPARDAEHDLLSTIADGVGAGKIDNAKVDAAIAKVATASATIHTATADALTQLHDALSPAERAALVDKVKAHWDVWHKVNVDEKASAHDKGTHLAKLTELLALTPDQVDKIGKALSADVPVNARRRSQDGGCAHPGLRDRVRGRQVRPEGARSVGDRRGWPHREARRGPRGALLRGDHAGTHARPAREAGGASEGAPQRPTCRVEQVREP